MKKLTEKESNRRKKIELEIELKNKQEAWREKYVYPLQKMFSEAGVFFSLNIISMDSELEDISKRRGELVGNFSMKERMSKFVSEEATNLYRNALKTFPWVITVMVSMLLCIG
jgi:flavin-dependent dehydrogenase